MSRADTRQTRLKQGTRIIGIGSVEFDLRRFGNRLLVGDREVRFFFHMEHELGRQIRWKVPDHFVKFRDPVDIALTGNRNTVFRPLELALEVPEILIRFQIRIILGNRNDRNGYASRGTQRVG